MRKSVIYFLIFQIINIGLFCVSASGSEQNLQVKKAIRIARNNAVLLDSINQLLVVFNKIPEQNTVILVAMEKKANAWRAVSAPLVAGIGRKGFAAPNAKREGDQKSPTGFFRLGSLFCYDQAVDTRLPFIQTTSEDKWIDDPDSPEYNRHVRGATQAKSYENLKIKNDQYKFCMVIEYNMYPVKKDFGSAIFLHLSENEKPEPSAGCVVITLKDMQWVLKWLNPESKPSILMGNEKILLNMMERTPKPYRKTADN